jgi:hypothetical protein
VIEQPDEEKPGHSIEQAADEYFARFPARPRKVVRQPDPSVSDGSTAEYYELPPGATELQDLISHRDMNAQIGEVFRACYRYGRSAHSDKLRDARKILFYARAEVERLEKYVDVEE